MSSATEASLPLPAASRRTAGGLYRRGTAILLALCIVCTLVSRLTPFRDVEIIGGLALLSFLALEWRRLGGSQRSLIVAAGAVCVALFAAGRLDPASLRQPLAASIMFASFVSAVGTIRHAARASPTVRRAAAYLFGRAAGARRAAILAGSHLLFIVFSVGSLGLLSEMVRRARLRFGDGGVADEALRSAVRGGSFVTVWSPLALTLTVATETFPHLNAVHYLAVAIAVTIALLLVSMAYQMLVEAPAVAVAVDTGAAGGARDVAALGGIAALVLALIVAVVLLAGLASAIAATLVVPLIALGWMWLQRGRLAPPARAVSTARTAWRQMILTLPDARPEIAVFSAAAFIGTAVGRLVEETGMAHDLLSQGVGSGVVLAAALWIVVLAGQLSIAPTVTVLVIGHALAPTPLGIEAPLVAALALNIGWGLTIATSPVSATLLVAARVSRLPGRRIGLGWNGPFAAVVGLLVSACLVVAGRWLP